jgi:hypothetical protein
VKVSTRTTFFATKEDLFQAFGPLEELVSLSYVLAGLFDTPMPERFNGIRMIPRLGESEFGDHARDRRFLIVKTHEPVQVREVPQRRGGTKYAIDQQQNPTSIVLVPGGRFGEGVVISGEISTISEEPGSRQLLATVSKAIKSSFRKVRQDFVGPGADDLLASGWRLTANVRTPSDFDLKE